VIAAHPKVREAAVAGAPAPDHTADRLIAARETWRTTIGATGHAVMAGQRAQYLAVGHWRRQLGMPEHVFARFGTEIKPLLRCWEPAGIRTARYDSRDA
jgi:hypothetical protein